MIRGNTGTRQNDRYTYMHITRRHRNRKILCLHVEQAISFDQNKTALRILEKRSWGSVESIAERKLGEHVEILSMRGDLHVRTSTNETDFRHISSGAVILVSLFVTLRSGEHFSTTRSLAPSLRGDCWC